MDRQYTPDSVVPGTVYRVLREIGQGGMGRVYEVEDTTIGKRYALKVLRGAHASSPDQVERLKLESRTLVRVAHENIVDVITAGVTTDGSFFYVMEMLNGRSLRRVLKDAVRLPAREALRIAVDIAEALTQAHREGVVHRDVKPDNIFVVKRQLTTSAKLLDFGVAALLDNLRTTFRETGKLLGTPRYASPQQQRGEKAHPSMDIWALAYVLFEMLVGHGPFRGRSLHEILIAIQGPELAFRLSDFLPDVHPLLDDAVARMLEKDAARRTPSMEEVTEALVAALRVVQSTDKAVGPEETTVETLMGLVNRTSPGEAPVVRSAGSERPTVRAGGAPHAPEAETAPPPFFADPPGSASRESSGAKLLQGLGPILLAGDLAEGELDPETLDREWGLLSTDTPAPTQRAASAVPRPAAGRAPVPGGARTPRPVVAAPARTEDSDSPSVRPSGEPRRAARKPRLPGWLAPAVAFSAVIAIALGFAIPRIKEDPRLGGWLVSPQAASVPSAAPSEAPAATPAAKPAAPSTPLTVPMTAEPPDAGPEAGPAITPARVVVSRPRPVVRADAPSKAPPATNGADDEFKFDSLLNR